jgi:hypothetical protein
MKATTTLLMTLFLLAGGQTSRQAGNDNRADIRVRTDHNRHAPNQYREHHQRCHHCYSKGFTLHIDGLRHIQCNFCDVHGFRIIRELCLDACALCFSPLSGYYGNYNLEELAVLETNRLNTVLDLSNRQWDRIYNINYRYLIHRERQDYYSVARRDREIRDVLHLGQRIEYALYLNDLRNDELCYDSSNDRY